MLSRTNSLFKRTLLILIPFIVLVVGFFTVLLFESVTQTEDYIVRDYLKREFDNVVQEVRHSKEFKAVSSDSFNLYWSGDTRLPVEYRNLPVGIHEMHDGDTHVLVEIFPGQSKTSGQNKLPGQSRKSGENRLVYIELKESFLSSIDQYEALFLRTFIAIALIVIVAGSVVSLFVARTIVRPVVALADDVERDSQPGESYYGYEREDEIGALSQSLTALVKRLHNVLDREKAFSRHASHELRTPVAVITNALAVLQLPVSDEEKRARNLHRIAKANKQIEEYIDVFLRLGKDSSDFEQQRFDLESLVNELLEDFSSLIQAESFTVQKNFVSSTPVDASPGMLLVLLQNLMLNAFTHGESPLTIDYDGDVLALTNCVGEIESTHNNYQYGLEVVARICEHQGWVLQIQPESNRFRVEVLLRSKN